MLMIDSRLCSQSSTTINGVDNHPEKYSMPTFFIVIAILAALLIVVIATLGFCNYALMIKAA